MSDDKQKSVPEPKASESTVPAAADKAAPQNKGNEKSHVRSAAPKAKKALWKRVLSNPLFWLVISILLLIFAIEYFERYTQVGVNNTYKIF